MNIVDTLKKLLGESGFAGFFQNGGWQNAVMIVISCGLLYLGIKKKFEPLLLVGIAFGCLLVNVSFTVQLVLWGELPVTLTQDAYYLEGDFEPVWQTVELTPCLDSLETPRSESLDLPEEAAEVLDWTLCPDRLAAAPGEGTARGSLGVNVVYYDGSRKLQNRRLRRELQVERKAAPSADWSCALGLASEPRRQGRALILPLTVRERYCQTDALRNLSGGTLTPGPRPEGPSLIVRSVSGDLWEIARDNGSTVRAIQSANELEELCLSRERLLLIPTGPGVITMEEEQI